MFPGNTPDARAELARLREEHRNALYKATFGGLSAEEDRSDNDRLNAIRDLSDQLLRLEPVLKS